MKVDVLDASQIKFKKMRWWSSWVDVCIYSYKFQPFLVQMRISRSNKKKFRSVCIVGSDYGNRQADLSDIGGLTQMRYGHCESV